MSALAVERNVGMQTAYAILRALGVIVDHASWSLREAEVWDVVDPEEAVLVSTPTEEDVP